MTHKPKYSFCCFVTLVIALPCLAGPIVQWDFRTGTHGWRGNVSVAPVQSTSEGLVVNCTGPDPWIEGPAVDFPEGHLVRVQVRMRSSADSSAQIFYGPQFVAERVHTFVVHTDNQWHEYTMILSDTPGPRPRFRLDPCSDAAEIVVQSIRISAVKRPPLPVLSKPVPLDLDAPSVSLTGNRLRLTHSTDDWNAWSIASDEQTMAQGYTGETVGIQFGDETQWLALDRASVSVTHTRNALTVTACLQDAKHARWQIQRTFAPMPGKSGIAVTTTVQADHDRDIVHIPWLTMLPGFGSFGSHKDQAVFAGLEYLANEPSSSQADLTGADHVRRMPDPLKVTFPLMAVAAQDHYLSLIWTPSDWVSPGFDSPDTTFGSHSHAFWLSGPAVGENRFANDLVAHTPMTLQANTPVTVQAWIMTGPGRSIVPAVQDYVQLKGLPELPEVEGGYQAAATLLAHGWLDSKINHDGRFRHAIWGDNFRPSPAADAAAFMQTLAAQNRNTDLSSRLNQGTAQALAQLKPSDPYASSVSHIRQPLAPLFFGKVRQYVASQHRKALAQLKAFDSQGRMLYRAHPDKPDYAKTHFAKHANGLGGNVVANILATATLCHDPDLTKQALRLLDQQTILYADTVPRGAQTWEIPLHTPDIMASAHMVRAYVLGFLLSGKDTYLDQARYWAWTGVPFLYLINPTDQAVGPYATIAVLGATNWQAPVWLGQPVQWCGLVYGDALHMLAKVDPDGPWLKLSQGITRAGVQMTWPTSDTARQGLLPDFFHLRAQVSDGPAINPGTLGARLAEAFDELPYYQLRRLPGLKGFIHAAGRITILESDESQITFKVETPVDRPHHILMSGFRSPPASVQWLQDDSWNPCAAEHDRSLGLVVIPAQKDTAIRLTLR